MNKKLLFLGIAIIFSFHILKAQIALENEFSTQNFTSFQYTRLISNSTKYYLLVNDSIKIFNIDQSVYKSFHIPGELLEVPFWIYYVSDSLFDLNSKVEYLIQYSNGITGSYNVKIFNEDGLEILSSDFQLHDGLVVELEKPIVNTPAGTKLVLRNSSSNKVRIYSLPGTLPNSMPESGYYNINSVLSNAYPNPTNEFTQINYKLPDNVNEGEIVIYDLSGNIIKVYQVNSSSGYITVSAMNLSAGTYLYNLRTKYGSIGSKRIVVIK